MTPLLRGLSTAAMTAALLGLSTSATHADRWWSGDRAGDVQQVAYSPEPPPCGTVNQSAATQDSTTDIVGLSVRHEDGAVELRAHFRDLTVWGERHLSFDVETDGRAYEVQLMKWSRRGPIETSVLQAAPPPESFDDCGGYATIQMVVHCPDLAMTRSPAQDTVTVVVPRSCLRGPRWVRVGVRNSRTVGDRYRSDVWSLTGAEPVPFSGPFGPRVRRD